MNAESYAGKALRSKVGQIPAGRIALHPVLPPHHRRPHRASDAGKNQERHQHNSQRQTHHQHQPGRSLQIFDDLLCLRVRTARCRLLDGLEHRRPQLAPGVEDQRPNGAENRENPKAQGSADQPQPSSHARRQVAGEVSPAVKNHTKNPGRKHPQPERAQWDEHQKSRDQPSQCS